MKSGQVHLISCSSGPHVVTIDVDFMDTETARNFAMENPTFVFYDLDINVRHSTNHIGDESAEQMNVYRAQGITCVVVIWKPRERFETAYFQVL
jgi:hypothetical protein